MVVLLKWQLISDKLDEPLTVLDLIFFFFFFDLWINSGCYGSDDVRKSQVEAVMLYARTIFFQKFGKSSSHILASIKYLLREETMVFVEPEVLKMGG